ncbi:MAG: 2Fe-2S iron-sulfur cluster-binding protein [Pseudomonadota bacterium]
MNQPLRLKQGGRIDRSKPMRFSFDGKQYVGYAGDTLASALLANGVRVTGRSFKYHRPRGIFGAGFEEPNTLVQLGSSALSEPNLKATQVELIDGLEARAVNCWPSARFDLMAVFRWLKPFMPSGFYYKTFIWPSWHWFEAVIRAAAGLGQSPQQPDPDHYDKRNLSVDVLVVGGGRYGLEAAIKAAEEGRDVVLVDDKSQLGGALLYEHQQLNGNSLVELLDRASKLSKLRVLTRCTAFGYYDHNHVVAVEMLSDSGLRQRLWHISAGEVVLATGAIERPIVFPNNDRPGVMLASAGRQYLHRYAVMAGRQIVIATNNDSAYEVALELQAAGVKVVAVLDARTNPDALVIAATRERGIRIEFGAAPSSTRGSSAISAVEWHRVDTSGKAQADTSNVIDCDCLLVSGGWNPTVHLFSQSGGSLRFDEILQAFVPAKSVQKERSVGAAAGTFDTPLNLQPLWSVDVSLLKRTPNYSWVDLASDVTEGDLRLAAREGFTSVEHLKRYTTTGMMTDQGKTSNVNAIGVMSTIVGRPAGSVGTTKFRPPFNPVTFGAVVGQHVGAYYQPLRRLPTDELQRSAGAVMEDYGGWARPAYIPIKGESEHDAIKREVCAVRAGVGIVDYSPLGKILVHGPDAATLLHRMYVNNMKTLKPGFCRYGVMIGEDGIVFDDGVLTRWDENTFQVGTTSGHAERVTEWLEEWLQCEWVDLDVIVEPVTTQWSVIMVAGPNARQLLQRLGMDIDLSAEAFPHMTARSGHIGDIPVRIMRVSFTGELSYEVSVPWSYGAALWQQLLKLGTDLDVTPFGLESLMVMRIEKGFLHVGTETEGTTMPQDIGFAEIIAKKADDFVGRRSTMTPEGMRRDRRQLVGLAAVDGATVLPVGGHLVSAEFQKPPHKTQGYVTSSAWSPTLGRPVAMGLVERGRERLGESLIVYSARSPKPVAVRIVELAAYDPKGERLHG